MNQIESPTFAARFCIASGKKVFLAALASDATVNKLAGRLRARPRLIDKVLKRIRELARQQVDTRYENPLDTALAAYLWCLDQVDRGVARIGAEFVLGAPQIWWARELSNVVLQPGSRSSVTANAVSSPARTSIGEAIGALPVMGIVRANDLILVSRLLMRVHSFKVLHADAYRRAEYVHTHSAYSVVNLKTPPAFILSKITTSDQLIRWSR